MYLSMSRKLPSVSKGATCRPWRYERDISAGTLLRREGVYLCDCVDHPICQVKEIGGPSMYSSHCLCQSRLSKQSVTR